MRTPRGVVASGAWALLLLSTPAWAAEPAACEPANRMHLDDLKSWRQRVLKARDPDVLTAELASIGFDPNHLYCWGKGRIVSAELLPATFGEKGGADRVILVMATGCSVKSDFVVLTAQPDGRWCTVAGDVYKGGSNGCEYDPLMVQLVHVTDPRRHTLKVFHSTGSTSTLISGAKGCDNQRHFTFYDVRDNNLALLFQIPAVPLRMSGGYPRTVHIRYDGQDLVFRARPGHTEYEEVPPAAPKSAPP